MKTLGIIGGIAPESTVVYYRAIISAYRKRVEDGSYPPLLINSIDLRKMLDLIGAGELDEVTDYLVDEIGKLERGGADFAIMASNTPHIVFDRIKERSPLPLISIVEAAAAAASQLGLKKLGLFGTRFTMQARFYPEAFARRAILVVAPDPDDQNFIHERYMAELVNAIFLPETKQRLLSIAERMKTSHGIDGLILGGTELPLILPDSAESGIVFLDTGKIHAEAAAAEIFT